MWRVMGRPSVSDVGGRMDIRTRSDIWTGCNFMHMHYGVGSHVYSSTPLAAIRTDQGVPSTCDDPKTIINRRSIKVKGNDS